MHFPEGFMLGLSTGTVCLAYCGPVLMPYLLGEGKSVAANFQSVSVFLAGRLFAYLIIGLITGWIGEQVQPVTGNVVFFGAVFMALSVLMIGYGFYRFRDICLGHSNTRLPRGFVRNWPALLPFTGGFATGMNLCPPFLLAVTGSLAGNSMRNSVLFFILFFAGTAIYFLPLPFLGFFRRKQVLRVIGKFAAIIAGIFYLYKGSLMLYAGLGHTVNNPIL
jgi:sulfite exporter TauE/SafE